MMIKRILILIFLSSLITKAHAYECEFDKLIPGVSSKSLEEINIFASKLYGQMAFDTF